MLTQTTTRWWRAWSAAFPDGLSFVAGYTYAKSLDTASGLDGTDQPQDNYNMRAEYGLSDFDMRQRVTFSGVWQLPFGAGRRWVQSGVPSHLLGGWQVGNHHSRFRAANRLPPSWQPH